MNNPIVVINALTAAVIKLENDNFDLKARLKDSREQLANLNPSSSVSDEDYQKLVKQLDDCREALNNRPKYDYPVHEHPSFIESQKQTERANEKIADLEQQLSAERCSASYLRRYFIEQNQDAIDHLCGCVVGFVKTSDRDMRFKGGILALSPLRHALDGGRTALKLQGFIAKINDMQASAEKEGGK